MRLLRLLTGVAAGVRDALSGGRRVIPRRPGHGTSTLTYGEVRRAAVALHGPGTKVRIWHDGSGHLLPPPPYRERERLYSFEHEFQLRNLLPSLGTMTLQEWRPGRHPCDQCLMDTGDACLTPGCPRHQPKPKPDPAAGPEPLDLSAAHRIVGGWPEWKRELAERILRPSKPPTAPKPKAEAAGGKPACCGRCAECPAGTWDVCGCGTTRDCPPDPPFAVGDRVRRRDGLLGEGRVSELALVGGLPRGWVIVRWDGARADNAMFDGGRLVRESALAPCRRGAARRAASPREAPPPGPHLRCRTRRRADRRIPDRDEMWRLGF